MTSLQSDWGSRVKTGRLHDGTHTRRKVIRNVWQLLVNEHLWGTKCSSLYSSQFWKVVCKVPCYDFRSFQQYQIEHVISKGEMLSRWSTFATICWMFWQSSYGKGPPKHSTRMQPWHDQHEEYWSKRGSAKQATSIIMPKHTIEGQSQKGSCDAFTQSGQRLMFSFAK